MSPKDEEERAIDFVQNSYVIKFKKIPDKDTIRTLRSRIYRFGQSRNCAVHFGYNPKRKEDKKKIFVRGIEEKVLGSMVERWVISRKVSSSYNIENVNS